MDLKEFRTFILESGVDVWSWIDMAISVAAAAHQIELRNRRDEIIQRLLDMNTTFKTLKETEIGRHVTKLRKHSSNEVRRLVKVLVKKWRDTVDEWVSRQNMPLEEEFNGERKSPDEASIHKSVKPASSYSRDATQT